MISNAFRYNAGLIRANGTPFFTGDGSTTSAGLIDRHGNPISSDKLKRVDAIHRTDWQGRQLLYATARTNLLTNSEFPNGLTDSSSKAGLLTAVSGLGWLGYFTTGVALGYDGSTLTYVGKTFAIPSGQSYTFSVFVRMDDGLAPILSNTPSSTDFLLNYFGGDVNPALYSVTSLGGGVYKISGSGVSSGYNTNFYVIKRQTFTSRTLICTGFSIQYTPGAYIKTAASAVPVTDYTLDGSTVDFGETPLASAVCDWTGVARR